MKEENLKDRLEKLDKVNNLSVPVIFQYMHPEEIAKKTFFSKLDMKTKPSDFYNSTDSICFTYYKAISSCI